MKKKALLALCGLLFFSLPVWAQINLLHEFYGYTGDGKWPEGSLLVSGSTFYGMARRGGKSDKGVIFRIETDGTGFALLHEFTDGTGDGEAPKGSLIISGTTLYGMTDSGGINDRGTIFKIQTDGSGFTLLHKFVGGAYDGQLPQDSLIISDTTLYGTTGHGGGSNRGTIFKIQTDGSGFTLLHSFEGPPFDGFGPCGNLIICDSTLYGMTYSGGNNDKGTVFKIQVDGSGFILLHEFAGGDEDGYFPYSSLIRSGSTLYGMTCLGGDNNLGTVFKIQTDGSGFFLLHKFAGENNDGREPLGTLILCGATLYGMTTSGGNYGEGTIFKIETDGSGFALRHEFSRWNNFLAGTTSGAYPRGSMILLGSTLYGMTELGGANDCGVIFSLPMSTDIITVQAQRREIGAFSILRHYGQIQFTVEDPAIPAAQYCIVRSEDGGDFILIKTVDPTDLQNGRFQMEDKYLEIDKQYSYRVEVYNATGQIIAISFEKTI